MSRSTGRWQLQSEVCYISHLPRLLASYNTPHKNSEALMGFPDIPQDVLQFVTENIDSVPQLEALLLMREENARTWSDQDIAARTYITIGAARDILNALHRRNLVVAETNPVQYRYRPPDDGGKDPVAQVAAAYRKHLVQMATLIHSKASAPVLEFARAFELKKDR